MKAESIGIEPCPEGPLKISSLVVRHCTLLSFFCGRQWNRTIIAVTRNTLAECRNKPSFAYLPFVLRSVPIAIGRTTTIQGLNLLPLPVALPERFFSTLVYPLSDSNRHLIVSKTIASAVALRGYIIYTRHSILFCCCRMD